ncbi:uncharacterized protein LOC131650141 [Vicia villosa]|uniref:uncharacterized protein LOC131650141 n=1 Tax=Vicia villosa TaxID=3911 RepID=UPI00273B61AD|nr:uncharacterized protein LOC131650141 [Vicia villosa]
MAVGGWETVRRRAVRGSQPRWDVFPWGGGMVGNRKGSMTSVYFSNFPESFSVKSFFELFACIGKVMEVAISPRKNRFGRKFGFVRFEGAEDSRLLAIPCDNVMIMGVKIHANLPRFERPRFESVMEGGSKVFHGGGVTQKKEATMGGGGFAGRVGRDGRSYAKVVHEGVGGISIVCSESRPKLIYSSKDVDKNRLVKAYVGVVSIPGSTYNIQSHFKMEGYFLVKVTPMGGNLCLLEESEEGVIEDLIGVGETWWKQWFQVIRRWNELDIDDGRVSWISVYGVPIHAWNAEFFMAVANSLGSFIFLDESTAEGSVFDTARMMVRVKLNYELPTSMEVLIDERNFVLFLKEDVVGAMRNVLGTRKVCSSVSSENDSLDSVDNIPVHMCEEEKECESDDVILLSNPVRLVVSNSENVLVPLSVKPKNHVEPNLMQNSKPGEFTGGGGWRE